MESILTALSEMSVGGSGGSGGAGGAGGAGDDARDDKPRLLLVEPAPPRSTHAPDAASEVSE